MDSPLLPAPGPAGEIERLPRRVLRKIVVQPHGSGWIAMIVGFNARFFTPAVSREFATREQAVHAALRKSRQTGLPVITVETLTGSCGPGEAV